MVLQVLHCPHCQGTDIVRHGMTRQGKQRYRCRACPEHGRTCLLAYASAGQSPAVKQQIVDMAILALFSNTFSYHASRITSSQGVLPSTWIVARGAEYRPCAF